jgi:hypothetical protein
MPTLSPPSLRTSYIRWVPGFGPVLAAMGEAERPPDGQPPRHQQLPPYAACCMYSLGSIAPRLSTTSRVPARTSAMYMFIRT